MLSQVLVQLAQGIAGSDGDVEVVRHDLEQFIQPIGADRNHVDKRRSFRVDIVAEPGHKKGLLFSVGELEQMGYSIAVFAISSILATGGMLSRLMNDIKTNGHTDKSFEDMMTYNELNEILGIEHYHELWNQYSQD